MIEAVATRNVLIRQERKDGRKIDVHSKRGEKISLTEEEAIKFWGALDLKDSDKKILLKFAQKEGIKRKI